MSFGDISLTTSRSAIVDPIHLSFSQRQLRTKGSSPSLLLTTNVNVSITDVTLSLRVLSGTDSANYVLSQVRLTGNDGDIIRSTPFTPTGRAGEYTSTVTVGSAGHIALIAFPANNPPASMRFEEYRQLTVVSNPVVIVSSRDRADLDSLSDVISQHTSELSQSLLAPKQGASGSPDDFYRMRGITPSDTRFPASEHSSARRALRGATEDIASRVAGYSDFLHTIHSEEEVKALIEAVPDEHADNYQDYSTALGEGASIISSVLDANARNPAVGNTVSHNLGNQSLVSSQYKLEATTTMDLRSPLLVQSSQVMLQDCRNHHTRSYLHQLSSVHSWWRAEQSLTMVSDLLTNYTSGEKLDVAESSTSINGTQYLYADVMDIQVGWSPTVGSKEPQAGTKSLRINAQDQIQSNAGGDYAVTCGRDYLMRASGSVNLRATTTTSIDGNMVFINCRTAVPPGFLLEPRDHKPIRDMPPYPRTSTPAETTPYTLGVEDRLPIHQA